MTPLAKVEKVRNWCVHVLSTAMSTALAERAGEMAKLLREVERDLSAPPPTCGTCKHCDTADAREGTGACGGPADSIRGWVPLHASCTFHEPKETPR